MKRNPTKPVLQNIAETTIDIVWGVNALSTGYVEISESADMAGARKIPTIDGQHFCQYGLDSVALHSHVTGLRSATRYYYRAWTIPVDYPDPYAVATGEAIDTGIHSFVTAGAAARGAFAMINDTHCEQRTVDRLGEILDQNPVPLVLWNGDAFEARSIKTVANVMLRDTPKVFSSTPILYTIGNHENRGADSRLVGKVMVPRPFEERLPDFWMLERNFAVRQGDIAIIGMDTGEDKADRRAEWAGMANFEPYRQIQTRWLDQALKRPEIASAPFKVAVCHIPLFDADPTHNPGDTDDPDPRYCANFSWWERSCAQMWGPLFDEAGVQLVLTAHMHSYRYDPPCEGRSWAQIVGGGKDFVPDGYQDSMHDIGTIIYGEVLDGRLNIKVLQALDCKVLGEFWFDKR